MVDVTKFSNDIDSITMLENLTKGLNFQIPDVDLDGDGYNLPASLIARLGQDPESITVDNLTEPRVRGDKTFDRIMYAFSIHLQEELTNGRITGADYATVYSNLASVGMQCAVQFEIGRFKQQWEGVLAQIQAIKANVELATAKVQLAIAKAQAHNMKAQYANTVAQLAIADAQYALVQQQRDSFMAKDRNDAAKLQVDTWAVQKGIDEGIEPPTNLQNSAIDKSLNKIYSVLDMKGN